MNERLKRELRKWADDDQFGWGRIGLLSGTAAALYANSNLERMEDAWKDWRARRASAKASARSAIDKQIRNSSAAARVQEAAPDPYTAAAKRMKARNLLTRTMAQAGLKNSEAAVMSQYGVKPGANPDIMRSYRELTARGASPRDAMNLARRYARQGRMGINGRMEASLPYNGIGRNVMMPNTRLTAMQRGIGTHNNINGFLSPESIVADADLLRRARSSGIGRSYQGSAARGANSLGGATPKTKSGFIGWNPDLFRTVKPGKIPSKAGRIFKGFRGLRGGLKAGGILGGSAVLGSILAYLANSYVHRGDQGL